jgi:hypothetical protein
LAEGRLLVSVCQHVIMRFQTWTEIRGDRLGRFPFTTCIMTARSLSSGNGMFPVNIYSGIMLITVR